MKQRPLSQSLALTGLALLAVVALAAGCATPTPEVIEKIVTQVVKEAVRETVVVEGIPQVVEKEVTKVVEVEKEAVPAPTMPPPQPGEETAGEASAALLPVAYRTDRMIIKNAELELLVADTDVAIDRVTQIAADTFGYIHSASTWVEKNFKHATITMKVPATEFENALRRLRALALKVQNENASGTDVTDVYVDMESRLRNLEATETRIRSFLDKAATVEEALQVNEELSEITAQIEDVKGKMNYIKELAAYSTITVHLSPEIPTPTPTATSTVTPTPTATPTATPVAWRPGETFEGARYVLGNIVRTLGNFLIWVIIVLGPFALLLGLIVWVATWARRRLKRGQAASPPTVSCPACGTRNPTGHAFCSGCGASLAPAAKDQPTEPTE